MNKPRALRMSSATKHTPMVFVFLIFCICFSVSSSSSIKSADSSPDPTPTPWPLQFHSILFMNYSGALQIIDLWYDWINGRNFNIMQDQLGELVYDLEWNNGTSFVYTLDPPKRCSTAQLDVGILRPNWLAGANYLGQHRIDGFLCNVWEKVDFIWYYEDVLTKRPVHWRFYTGRTAHVMTFEVGAVLEDAKWQGPEYCFVNKTDAEHHVTLPKANIGSTRLDGFPRPSMSLSMDRESSDLEFILPEKSGAGRK